MKKIAQLVLIFAVLMTVQLSAQQAVSRISIQGTLKNSNGASVADGNYTVKFLLYNAQTGGTALWQEDAMVEVVGGIYSHYLGSVVPLEGSDFGSTLYLGVRIGNFELTPRTELTYAPYTFSSNVSQLALRAEKVICSGAVGDVKYSILEPEKFAEVNGDCWVPMDGRPLAQGDVLRQLTGMASLPNGGGLFVRAQDFANSDNDPDRNSNSPVATMQGDNLKAHNHGVTDPGHSHSGGAFWPAGNWPEQNQAGNPQDYTLFTNTGTSTTGITINNTGGAETRPKNLNLWVYIRIN